MTKKRRQKNHPHHRRVSLLLPCFAAPLTAVYYYYFFTASSIHAHGSNTKSPPASFFVPSSRKRLRRIGHHHHYYHQPQQGAAVALSLHDNETPAEDDNNNTVSNSYSSSQQQRAIRIRTYGSSLQRMADSMNGVSVEQIHQMRVDYEMAIQQLRRKLSDPTLSGAAKHQLHCQHRFQFGRQPLVCPTCWSYLPICCCSTKNTTISRRTQVGVDDSPNDATTTLCIQNGGNSKPTPCSVVFWTHHKEWGSPSNTGSAVVAQLGGSRQSNCKMLLKGLDVHDAELQRQIHDDPNVLPVVLWTESENDDNDRDEGRSREFVGVEQLREELTAASNSNKSLLLIALEGTWKQAGRMSTRLPTSVRGLSLSTEQVFGWRRTSTNRGTAKQRQQSILHPLRKQKQTEKTHSSEMIVNAGNKVCTAEAVVSALFALSVLSESEASALLDSVQRKIRDTAAYQGKVDNRG